jgi:hypothetical protein
MTRGPADARIPTRTETPPIDTGAELSRAGTPPSAKAARPPRIAEPAARLAVPDRPRVESAKPAPTHDAAASSRCGDILQKASLEPLSAAEVAFLKRECR